MGWSGTSLSAGHIFVQALSEPKLSVLDILVNLGSQLREAADSRLIKGCQFSCLGNSGFEESRDFPPTGIAGVWENVYGMSCRLVSPTTKHESTRSVMSTCVNLNRFSVATEKPLNYIRVEEVMTGAPTSQSLVCTLQGSCCLVLKSMYR